MEDIDHIFERGGITGGVWETGGRTVEKAITRRDVESAQRQANEKTSVEVHEDHTKE